MKIFNKVSIALFAMVFMFSFTGLAKAATDPGLGTSASFSVLGGTTVTNTGSSVLNGSLGVWPGLAITGFPPGIVNVPGTTHAGDAVAQQAQSDVTAAYLAAAGQACDTDLTGQDLGGQTLTPGTYCFDVSAQLTGTLTLDGQDDPDAVFVFQIGSTLTTATDSSVSFINGAQACHVYWQVGSSATLGTTTDFHGTILALTSITANTGADVIGRLLARNGAVTLDTNDITVPVCQAAAEDEEDETPTLPDAGLAAGGNNFPWSIVILCGFLAMATTVSLVYLARKKQTVK